MTAAGSVFHQGSRGHGAAAARVLAAPVLVISGEDDHLAVRADEFASTVPHGSAATVPGGHLDDVAQPRLRGAVAAVLSRLG